MKVHGKHRIHNVKFKWQVLQEYLNLGTLHDLWERHELPCTSGEANP